MLLSQLIIYEISINFWAFTVCIAQKIVFCVVTLYRIMTFPLNTTQQTSMYRICISVCVNIHLKHGLIFFVIQKWSLAGIRITESCRLVSSAWWNWILTGTFTHIFKKCHLTKDQSLFLLKSLEKSESKNISNCSNLIYFVEFNCQNLYNFGCQCCP